VVLRSPRCRTAFVRLHCTEIGDSRSGYLPFTSFVHGDDLTRTPATSDPLPGFEWDSTEAGMTVLGLKRTAFCTKFIEPEVPRQKIFQQIIVYDRFEKLCTRGYSTGIHELKLG
jgi:hypothetical protein